MNILFVCTGNTCRSPMAAALMKRRMEREGIPGKAESAGLAASCEPASQLAVTVMREWDIDLREHHSRPVTAMLCEAADLVAVMSLRHRLALTAMGVAPQKIVVLGEESGGSPDPYGGDAADYRQCRDALERAVAAIQPVF